MKQVLIIVMLTILGCSANAQESPNRIIDRKLAALSPEEQHSEKGMRILIAALRSDVAPVVSATDKKEAESIADILSNLLDGKVPEPTRLIFQNATLRFYKLMLKIDPMSFSAHYELADIYTQFATHRYFISDSFGPDYPAEVDRNAAMLKKESISHARQLVRDFPKEPKAYGLLSYTLASVGKDMKEARTVAERCLEIDIMNEYCRELLKGIEQGN